MRTRAARAYHRACLALGRLLRASRYATTRVVHDGGAPCVRKRRHVHAPLLIALGEPLMRALGTGVRVLPQRAWEARERLLHDRLHRRAVAVDGDGTLVLPFLAGRTLASLLEDAAVDDATRASAVALAVAALAALHAAGITHGDAMAENVMVDLDAGAAHWFDFETEHDARRPMAWRRADDLRALLATCLLRTAPERLDVTLRRIVDGYANDGVTRLVAASFGAAFGRPLPFHLGQAPLSYESYARIARALGDARR